MNTKYVLNAKLFISTETTIDTGNTVTVSFQQTKHYFFTKSPPLAIQMEINKNKEKIEYQNPR